MKKHYVLNINSQAQHDWDKCVIRNPITGEHPDLKDAIAQAIGNQPGSYLISVQIEVEILEKVSNPLSTNLTPELVVNSKETREVKLPQIVASRTINYQQDVKPWLGGVMIAILPEQLSTKKDENLLVVVGIKNKLKARKFVKKLEKENQGDWQERKYKGITITEATNQSNEIVSSALLGNKLAISNNQRIIEKAIDTYKGESSLASEPSAKEVLSQKLTIANPVAQVYFTNFDYIIEQVSQENISAAALAELQQLESVVIGVGIKKEGIHIQSTTSLKAETENSNLPSTDSKILTKLPKNTIAAINGQNINQIWSTTAKQIETDRDLRRVLDMGRLSFNYGTGLDLDKDFFSWMDGEFALGFMTTKKEIIPELGIGLESAFIIETSNPQKAKDTLKQVEKSLQSNLGINSQQKKIANKQTITEWRIPQNGFSLAHGWVDKNYLVLSIGDSIFESMHNSAKNSFDRSEKFTTITKKLPNNNLGYFYIDMNQAMSIVNKLPNRNNNISPEATTILNSLSGIGATATMPDKSTNQLDVLVLFK